jgi:hypothetical protein
MGWNDAVLNARRRQAVVPGANGSFDYGSVGGVQGAQDYMIDEERGYGSRGTRDYLSRAENFDASTALNKYAQGAWGSIQTALGDTLKAETGKSVGAGRFDSGFLDEDKGVVINRATQQFSNDLAQQSLGAASLDLRNTESLGQFGNERSGRATDLLLSRSEQVQNDARAEEERRRKSRGGIAGAIGGALGAGVGFFAGGPAGAAAGWNVGSSVGRGVGGG